MKWATARMSPKTAPVQKLAIGHTFAGTDDELEAAINGLLEGEGAAPPDA